MVTVVIAVAGLVVAIVGCAFLYSSSPPAKGEHLMEKIARSLF